MVATVPAYHNEWFIQHEYCDAAFAAWTSQNFPKISPLSGGPWGYKDFIALFTVYFTMQMILRPFEKENPRP